MYAKTEKFILSRTVCYVYTIRYLFTRFRYQKIIIGQEVSFYKNTVIAFFSPLPVMQSFEKRIDPADMVNQCLKYR